MPPAKRRSYAGRQNRHAGKPKREQRKAEQAARKQEQRNAIQAVRLMQREHTAAGTLYRSKRRAAINRIQYSKAPSLRSLPFASMLNAYMGYSLVRSELSDAVEYANIMKSARSILRVADMDLGSFETRFDDMARHVRKIGIDTKYTAVEIAGVVKFLSMAGMDIKRSTNPSGRSRTWRSSGTMTCPILPTWPRTSWPGL